MEDIERQASTDTLQDDDLESHSAELRTARASSLNKKVGAVTIHEQLHVRDTRREQRLKKMKERQFDKPTLHQLFRIFDSSNSNLLSLTDFQTGLIAMGFREAEGESVHQYIMFEP